mgnify:CR=1 FL=1
MKRLNVLLVSPKSYDDRLDQKPSEYKLFPYSVVYLVNYVFKGGPAPDPPESGDANCDELSNITDAVAIIDYIFNEGPSPPCNPF